MRQITIAMIFVAVGSIIIAVVLPIYLVSDTDGSYDKTMTNETLYKHEDHKINATQYAVRVCDGKIVTWLHVHSDIRVVSTAHIYTSNGRAVLVVYELPNEREEE